MSERKPTVQFAWETELKCVHKLSIQVFQKSHLTRPLVNCIRLWRRSVALEFQASTLTLRITSVSVSKQRLLDKPYHVIL